VVRAERGGLAVLAVVFAVAGCGGSTTRTGAAAPSSTAPSTGTTPQSGSASYVGQAINAVVFIQWTRAGSSLSGSLQEAIRKERGSNEVDSSSSAFTGTISGDGVTLTLNEGLGSTKALVGQLNANGFTMTFPGQEHALTSITFVPGVVSDYNHAVLEIEGRAEQGGQSASASTGPVYVAYESCSGRQYRPEMITLACGDGGLWASDIVYHTYGGMTATATVELHTHDCVPDCAESAFHTFPGTITLADVVRCEGTLYYSRARYRFTDGAPYGGPSSDTAIIEPFYEHGRTIHCSTVPG
jgi:hypothetical protein